MWILRCVRNCIIFVMSYISFFQFLFKINTIDQLINVQILAFVDERYNGAIISGVLLSTWCVCDYVLRHHESSNQEKAGKAFHQIQHQFRNIVFDLRKENSENAKTKKIPSYETYYSQMRSKAELICNEISLFFDSNFNKNFNVCIKMIDVASSRATKSISEMKVITLCRSGCDKIEREKCDATEEIYVAKNSDFQSILEKDGLKGSSNVFAVNNLWLYCLLQKIQRNPYKTSSKDFLKKYNSTIVVPIRINSKKLPSDSDFSNANEYQVFGFLCIDYKHRISKRLMKNMLEYEKAFGDLLYIFFNEVLVGDNMIRKATTPDGRTFRRMYSNISLITLM